MKGLVTEGVPNSCVPVQIEVTDVDRRVPRRVPRPDRSDVYLGQIEARYTVFSDQFQTICRVYVMSCPIQPVPVVQPSVSPDLRVTQPRFFY